MLLFHWKGESQHAILDELEWVREDATLAPAARDTAVGELIELVGGVDGLLQVQARADAAYFCDAARIDVDHGAAVESNTLRAIAGSTSSQARWSRASRRRSAS